MGIMNGIGAHGRILPLRTLCRWFIITGDGSIEEWRNVFYLAAVIMVVFSIPYLFFGSGEEQPWNNEMSQTLENSANSHPKHDENQETKT
ncbi:sodium-dependent phosphate transport protein 3-like isoform X1 [Homalodisca vitripennis]|uniref:sodium-dependent phosphate transport protein 3-like isoform X1 n=1 Tax=Homalodisca vitripennis TaxID=197043 RepID=UPI001EECD697|nr:sodium-dependent phosphate transport protein 3-like isoform X1 [Homalodisca vitripennis]